MKENEDGRRSLSAEEVPGLLKELEASGATIRSFGRERGIKTWRLYEAKRKGRRRRKRSKPREFVEVKVVDRAKDVDPLELVLPSGCRVLIPVGFDETSLRRVMGVLASC